MIRIIVFLILLASSIGVFAQSSPLLMPLDKLTGLLNEALDDWQRPAAHRLALADSLMDEANKLSGDDRLRAIIAVGAQYRLLNVDSAINCFEKVISDNPSDSTITTLAKIELSSVLPLAGRTFDALHIYNLIDPSLLSGDDLIEYHIVGEDLGRILYGAGSDSTKIQRPMAIHSRALMDLLPDKDPRKLRSTAIYYFDCGKPTVESANMLSVLYSDAPLALKADVAMMLAFLCKREQKLESEEALHYLMQSAYIQLKEGILTGFSPMLLGEELLARGNEELAHKVLSVALDVEMQSGNRIAWGLLEPHIGFVKHRTEAERNGWRTAAWVFVATLVVALIALSVAWFMAYRRRKNMQNKKHDAASLSDEQRTFIIDYLNLHASLSEKHEEMLRMMRRKLQAGQVNEVHTLLKSDKLLDEHASMFNETFDRTTLNIFPSFVDDINSLLLPDKQIELTNPAQLNTELRIVALTRIGIEDTAMIARFLGVSNNTIYTYRNRMRSRARNRETFMSDIRAMGLHQFTASASLPTSTPEDNSTEVSA